MNCGINNQLFNYLMPVLNHVFATGIWGLVKPGDGFALVPAIFGLIAIFQIFQFIYYGLPQNEPKEGWGLSSGSSLLRYRWQQFAGVQILTVIIAISVILAGPEIIFFPLGLK